jgi:nucleoside 2-deoxyribosyltransferase
LNIYLASSWRNLDQPRVLSVLRDAGHKVYDFRSPTPDNHGFGWHSVDPDGAPMTVQRYLKAIMHPVADHGFRLDMTALRQCDAVVLLLPCGRSAHLEAGWAVGAGRRVVVYTRDGEEPELMYKMCAAIVSTDDELRMVLR